MKVTCPVCGRNVGVKVVGNCMPWISFHYRPESRTGGDRVTCPGTARSVYQGKPLRILRTSVSQVSSEQQGARIGAEAF